jgi:hypothetical protein
VRIHLVRPPTEFDSAYWAFRRLILNIILMDATILLRGVDRFLTIAMTTSSLQSPLPRCALMS